MLKIIRLNCYINQDFQMKIIDKGKFNYCTKNIQNFITLTYVFTILSFFKSKIYHFTKNKV